MKNDKKRTLAKSDMVRTAGGRAFVSASLSAIRNSRPFGERDFASCGGVIDPRRQDAEMKK